jgi:Flp pilus assembly protein protease CpaA
MVARPCGDRWRGVVGSYLLLVLVHPAGMGWGDVKLAGLLGGVLAYLSWSALLIGAFGAFLLGAVVGVAVMAAGRGGRKTALPFGPSRSPAPCSRSSSRPRSRPGTPTCTSNRGWTS